MAKSLKPTAANVSKILSGEPRYFTKSISHPGLKKIWPGFNCKKSERFDGCIVMYKTDDILMNRNLRCEILIEYQSVLNGYFVTDLCHDGTDCYLKVTVRLEA